jgi:hypothetical protein
VLMPAQRWGPPKRGAWPSDGIARRELAHRLVDLSGDSEVPVGDHFDSSLKLLVQVAMMTQIVTRPRIPP